MTVTSPTLKPLHYTISTVSAKFNGSTDTTEYLVQCEITVTC